MLHPVPESSRYEVLVSERREVPGRAVGVNDSRVLREEPSLRALGVAGSAASARYPLPKSLAVGGGLGARGLQPAEPPLAPGDAVGQTEPS